MNTLQIPEKTMTSLEIANLVDSRHDSVKRTIERLYKSLVISQPPSVFGEKSPNGKTPFHYEINKRDSYVVVAQISPEFTGRLVDRWQELESKQAAPQLPQSFAEALQLAADQAKQLEEADKQLQIAAPKAEFYDQVTGSTDTIDMGKVAKVLNIPGYGRNRIFQFLRDKSILQGNNEPYQNYVDRGYFRIIESKFSKPDGSTHISLKTVVYQKGMDYIRKQIEQEKAVK